MLSSLRIITLFHKKSKAKYDLEMIKEIMFFILFNFIFCFDFFVIFENIKMIIKYMN